MRKGTFDFAIHVFFKVFLQHLKICDKIDFEANTILVRGVTMIQDLGERKLYNEFEKAQAKAIDKVFVFDQDKILVARKRDGRLCVPKVADFSERGFVYLFRIEEDGYYLLQECMRTFESGFLLPEIYNLLERGFFWESTRNLRDLENKELAFAASTAHHLYQWYRDSKFCGRCGKPLLADDKERMMRCDSCGNMVYPKIAPAVIVGVINGDKILLTKYNGRVYKKYALIAGFTEIGETAEETVAREVMEEAGLRVKDITYYKSQPWGTDCNLLLGFFCHVDGSDTITMDAEELSVAEWVKRDEMEVRDDGISLTREMMRVFQEGKIL